MKGTIFDIKRFAVHDGPGIRTTVFFKGCPLKCHWCHNPESIQPHLQTAVKTVKIGSKCFSETEDIGREITAVELFTELVKDKIFMESSGGGITFSGGEPLMQHKFLKVMLKYCKDSGLHTALDTSGMASVETIVEMAKFTDLFLYDLKLIDDHLHKEYTGVSNKTILDNLLKISELNCLIRIRIPLIPEVSTTDSNIESTIAFLDQIKQNISGVDLLPFHPSATNKYIRLNVLNKHINTKPISEERVLTIQNKFASAGYNTTIGG